MSHESSANAAAAPITRLQRVGCRLGSYAAIAVLLVMWAGVGYARRLAVPFQIATWIAALLVAAAVLVWARSLLYRLQEDVVARIGPQPAPPPPAPDRPSDLDPPTLRLPELVLPGVAAGPEPRKTLPGQWQRCQVCGRPLTDPTSRYHGVGPDCLRRTGIHYPNGPVNPEHAVWEARVEVLKAGLPQKHAEARRVHAEAVERAKAEHAERMEQWEGRAEQRAIEAAEYREACRRWESEVEEAEARREEWRLDPRFRLVDRYRALRIVLYVEAGVVGLQLLIWLPEFV